MAVEEGDDAVELLGLMHPDTAVVGADVGLQQGAREVLEHAVLEDLCAPDAQAPDAPLVAHREQLFDLLLAPRAVPEKVPLGPHRQLPAFGQRPVGASGSPGGRLRPARR